RRILAYMTMVITSYTPAHKISRILVLPGQNSTRITALIWSFLNARQQTVGHKDTVLALTRIAKRIYDVDFPAMYPLQNVATTENNDIVVRTSNKCKPTNFNNMFDKFLVEHNLAIDPITNQKRVLYSLRHTYATFKLTYDKVPIHTLAKQMGTSVGMIEKHYSHLNIKDAVEQLRSDESRSLMNMLTSFSDMDKDMKKLKSVR
ncbi:MAG: hypothetical protein NTU92_08755, partial [Methylotenera sp.]|nr:hypothetical protein [Methylotenera sp.]